MADPGSHKFACAQQPSIIKRRWCICDQAHADPEGTRKYPEEEAKHPRSPLLCRPLPACTSVLVRSSLWSTGKGKEVFGLLYKCSYIIRRAHLTVEGCSSTDTFWDIPEGQWRRKIFPVCRTSNSAFVCSLCLEGEMTRYAITHIHGYVQWFPWMVRHLEETWLENVWLGNFGKKYKFLVWNSPGDSSLFLFWTQLTWRRKKYWRTAETATIHGIYTSCLHFPFYFRLGECPDFRKVCLVTDWRDTETHFKGF